MGVPVRLSIALVRNNPIVVPSTPAIKDGLDVLGDKILKETSEIVSSTTGSPAYVESLGNNYDRFVKYIENTELLKNKSPENKFPIILKVISKIYTETNKIVSSGVATTPNPIPPSTSMVSKLPPVLSAQILSELNKEGLETNPSITLFCNGLGDFIYNSYPG